MHIEMTSPHLGPPSGLLSSSVDTLAVSSVLYMCVNVALKRSCLPSLLQTGQ